MREVNAVNVFEDIQAICREFRRRLKRGESTSIEECLGSVDEQSQEMLFQNLLHVDIEFRRQRGETPSSNEYIARFPKFARRIREAFLESTMMSEELAGDTPDSHQPTVTLEIPAARKLGQYQLVRELGRGGFGVVYEARHLQRGDRVALKTLPMIGDGHSQSAGDAERLHRFRREFRSLSEINHPNLAGMQTLEVDGKQWFFTMDLLDGTDFLDYVRPGGQLDEQRLRDALKQLVRGIVALHEQGIVHRDLKPSNVLVSAAGDLVILDFGLVAELQHLVDQTLSVGTKHFAGTPRYAAPEQALGVRTAAVDWYATGVMLYEAITGEAPFQGSGIDLLMKKQSMDPPKLAGRSGVPEDLGELVDSLLRRTPEERPDGGQVADRFGIELASITHESTDSSIVEESGAERDELLIGREEQLARLQEKLEHFETHLQPGVVFLSGRSGEGKTSLAEIFLTKVRRNADMVVLAGRCYDRESVPFKAIDCLIDSLVAFLRSRTTDEVAQLLPNDIGMLAQVFPVLGRVESVANRAELSVAGIDSRQVRYRAFAALRELLTTMGRSKPVILFIDDLQWGDADSARTLHELLQPPHSPPVMLLGTYRSDEVDESPFLNDWRDRQSETDGAIEQSRIEIPPLTREQCILFFASRLDLDPDEIRDQAAELLEGTQGNPYFLEQLIEGFDRQRREFRLVPLGEMIMRKLDRLPKEAKPLLEVIAVSGQAIRLEEASDVSGQNVNAFSTATHMRSEKLVRLIGGGQQQLVDTYHDKIRKTVLADLDPIKQRQLHIRYGEYLEQRQQVTEDRVLEFLDQDPSTVGEIPFSTDRVFDLAYHFHAAGDRRSFAYQMLAAELSHRAYAAEDALEFLSRAKNSLPDDASRAMRYWLFDRLAAAHIRLKKLDSGTELHRQALDHAPSKLARARTYFEIGKVNGSRASYSDSLSQHKCALQELGVPIPPTWKATLQVPLMLARVILIPRRRWQDSTAQDDIQRTVLEQKIYQQLSVGSFETPDIKMYFFSSRAAFLAANSGDPARYATGIAYLGGHYALFGWSRIGRVLLHRVESIADDLSDLEARAEFLKMSACAHSMSGDFASADQEFSEARPLFEKAGEHLSLTVCIHLWRHLKQIVGTSGEETEVGRQVLETAQEVGDPRAQCWGQYDIASGLARRGETESAKWRIERAQEFVQTYHLRATESILLATESYVLLQGSDYQAARASAEKSWQITKRLLLFLEYNCRSLPLLLESRVGPNWTSTSCDRKGIARLLFECRLLTWIQPNLQSPLLRSRGRVYWAMGKRKKAVRCFRRAVRSAASRGLEYERAKSLLDLAAVQEEDRQSRRSEAIDGLKKMESVIPYAERWLLGNQFDEAVVAPPPDLVSAAD